VDGERLVVQTRLKPRYTLEELLAKCDYSQPMTPEERDPEEREWIDAPPVGRELQ
jgi:antitoxin ChpS